MDCFPLWLRLRVVLKHCKLQYKRDVTFATLQPNGRFFHICCKLQYTINFFLSGVALAALGLRSQAYASRCRLASLRSQGYAVKVTLPSLRSQGYFAKVTQPRYAAKVTQPRLRCQGYAARVALPRLHSQGYVVQITQTRLHNQGDIIEDPKAPHCLGSHAGVISS